MTWDDDVFFAFQLKYRPLSHGGHFESQENKKLCFCTSSLALGERLAVQNLLFQHCVIKVYSTLFSLGVRVVGGGGGGHKVNIYLIGFLKGCFILN